MGCRTTTECSEPELGVVNLMSDMKCINGPNPGFHLDRKEQLLLRIASFPHQYASMHDDPGGHTSSRLIPQPARPAAPREDCKSEKCKECCRRGNTTSHANTERYEKTEMAEDKTAKQARRTVHQRCPLFFVVRQVAHSVRGAVNSIDDPQYLCLSATLRISRDGPSQRRCGNSDLP